MHKRCSEIAIIQKTIDRLEKYSDSSYILLNLKSRKTGRLLKTKDN